MEIHHFFEGGSGGGGSFNIVKVEILPKLVSEFSAILLKSQLPFSPHFFFFFLQKMAS